jgi:hypothetical protein
LEPCPWPGHPPCAASRCADTSFTQIASRMTYGAWRQSVPVVTLFWGGLQGVSPSGTVTMHSINLPLYVTPMAIDGHPTIQITYHLTAGIQKQYHENPGVAYHAASLPIDQTAPTPDGNRLLKRLKYAFQHGLTFQVGTSMVNDRSKNCKISWAFFLTRQLDRVKVPIAGLIHSILRFAMQN